jgi:hypothetical protein
MDFRRLLTEKGGVTRWLRIKGRIRTVPVQEHAAQGMRSALVPENGWHRLLLLCGLLFFIELICSSRSLDPCPVNCFGHVTRKSVFVASVVESSRLFWSLDIAYPVG